MDDVCKSNRGARTLVHYAVTLGLLFVSADLAAAQISVSRAKGLGYLGLRWEVRDAMETNPERQRLPIVAGIYPCSPAHLAGLEPGDVLVRVNQQDPRAGPAFPPGGPGSAYRVEALRGEEPLEVEFLSTEVPDSMPSFVTEAPVGRPERWGCEKRGLLQ